MIVTSNSPGKGERGFEREIEGPVGQPRRTILTAAIQLLLRKHHGIVGYECVIIQKCERKEPR